MIWVVKEVGYYRNVIFGRILVHKKRDVTRIVNVMKYSRVNNGGKQLVNSKRNFKRIHKKAVQESKKPRPQ